MRSTSVYWVARRALVVLALAGSILIQPQAARAHGPEGVEEPLTRFEHFQLDVCSPCVIETAPIATLAAPSMKLAAGARTAAPRTTRAGEISVEALRSQLLGRPSRQMLAIRLTLFVATGSPGELYRIGSGLVDEEEIGAFVSGLGEIAQAAAAGTPSDGNAVEIDVRSGSIRIGVLRAKGESMVYIQAGDVRGFARRPVSDIPTTLYLPVADLAAMRGAVAQAATRMQKMRSGQ
jgi:hypothetical protein